MNEDKDLPDIDDAPPVREAFLGTNELAQMSEDDWLLLKNELQEYLHRVEQTKNSAYESADIVHWIEENGDYFNQFYQHLRNTKPELLLRFRTRALDKDEQNDVEFIRAWVAFRDSAQQ
ncbi:MAG: hypothetical protein Q7S52_05840 [bacterium]|nr:hypothetical protein [bacterium]